MHRMGRNPGDVSIHLCCSDALRYACLYSDECTDVLQVGDASIAIVEEVSGGSSDAVRLYWDRDAFSPYKVREGGRRLPMLV